MTNIDELYDVLKDLVLSLSVETNSEIRVHTISDVAKILKCKERTVKHHLYETRDLKYLKIGREVRIREKDLIDFLSNSLMLCVHDQEILP